MSTPSQPDADTYRPDIDGLRAVAILLVVGYHVGLPGSGGAFLGVDVFFAISGWLIIGGLLDQATRTGKIDLLEFVARRVRRLLPAALAVTAVVLVASWVVLDPIAQQQATAKSAIAALGSVANLHFYKGAPTGYFAIGAAPPPLLHTWSLSVEEQFYALTAIGMVVIAWISRRRGLAVRTVLVVALATAGAASLGVAAWSASTHPAAGFYLPFPRAYEFIVGGLAAVLAPTVADRLGRRTAGAVGLLGLVAIGALVVRAPDTATWPGAWALLPAGGAAALMVAGSTRELPYVARLLGVGPLTWIGRRSYAWYLWHWPALALGEAWYLGTLPLPARLSIVVAALGLADLTYRLVETPGRRIPIAGRGQRWRLVAVAAAVTVALVGAFGWQGLHARSAKESPRWAALAAASTDLPVLPDACVDLFEVLEPTEVAPPCDVVRQRTERPTIVVWGDSHAWHLVPGLEVRARQASLNLVAITRGGCPPYDPAAVDRPRSAPDYVQTCDEANRQAVARIAEIATRGPTSVVASGRWEPYLGLTSYSLADRPVLQDSLPGDDYRIRLEQGLPAALDEIVAAGARVELVLSTPEFRRTPAACDLAPWRTFACDVAVRDVRSYRHPATEFLRSAAPSDPEVSIVDLVPALCDDRCPIRGGNAYLYMDDDHLSHTGSLSISEAWEPTIRRLLAPTIATISHP